MSGRRTKPRVEPPQAPLLPVTLIAALQHSDARANKTLEALANSYDPSGANACIKAIHATQHGSGLLRSKALKHLRVLAKPGAVNFIARGTPPEDYDDANRLSHVRKQFYVGAAVHCATRPAPSHAQICHLLADRHAFHRLSYEQRNVQSALIPKIAVTLDLNSAGGQYIEGLSPSNVLSLKLHWEALHSGRSAPWLKGVDGPELERLRAVMGERSEPQEVTLARIVEQTPHHGSPLCLPLILDVGMGQAAAGAQRAAILRGAGALAPTFGGDVGTVHAAQTKYWAHRGGVVRGCGTDADDAAALHGLRATVSTYFPVKIGTNGDVWYNRRRLDTPGSDGGVPGWAIEWIESNPTTETPTYNWNELTVGGGVKTLRATLKDWNCLPPFVIARDRDTRGVAVTLPLDTKSSQRLRSIKYTRNTPAVLTAARGLVRVPGAALGDPGHMFNCSITTGSGGTTVEYIDYANHIEHIKRGNASLWVEEALEAHHFQRPYTHIFSPVAFPRISGTGSAGPCTAIAMYRHIVMTKGDRDGAAWSAGEHIDESAATRFIALLHRGAFVIMPAPYAARAGQFAVAGALVADPAIAATILRNMLGPQSEQTSVLPALARQIAANSVAALGVLTPRQMAHAVGLHADKTNSVQAFVAEGVQAWLDQTDDDDAGRIMALAQKCKGEAWSIETKTGFRVVAEIDGTPIACEVTETPEMVQIEAKAQQSSAAVRWAKQGGEWTQEPGGDLERVLTLLVCAHVAAAAEMRAEALARVLHNPGFHIAESAGDQGGCVTQAAFTDTAINHVARP